MQCCNFSSCKCLIFNEKQGEIARRREEYQYNELQVHDDEPLWQKYLENFKVQ
jgi:sugar (pentulose or hexulose) kinase